MHSSLSFAQRPRPCPSPPFATHAENPSSPCALSCCGAGFSLRMGLSQSRTFLCASFSTYFRCSLSFPNPSWIPPELDSGAVYTALSILVWSLIRACFIQYGNHHPVSLSTPVRCALCDGSVAIRRDMGEAQENKVLHSQILETGGTPRNTGSRGDMPGFSQEAQDRGRGMSRTEPLLGSPKI